ncbi:MAG: ribose 5-phosphate isomerase B [Candidatus Omnitrophica bacterium]|nr:ribose 5-phosphate isomerase B [Candidatus Omnitrophota bacterium]
MKVYIGADHRGFDYKTKIKKILEKLGHEVFDVGTNDPECSCDYPRFAYEVATKVAKFKNSRGILVCMSGIGQSIAANKVKGAYAALVYSVQSARLSRQHNNANILVIGMESIKAKDLKTVVEVWMNEKFEGGRHQRRFNLIKKIEAGKAI